MRAFFNEDPSADARCCRGCLRFTGELGGNAAARFFGGVLGTGPTCSPRSCRLPAWQSPAAGS